jgi:hypothetical protein
VKLSSKRVTDFLVSPSFFSPSTRMQPEGQARSQDLQAMQRDFPVSGSWVKMMWPRYFSGMGRVAWG